MGGSQRVCLSHTSLGETTCVLSLNHTDVGVGWGQCLKTPGSQGAGRGVDHPHSANYEPSSKTPRVTKNGQSATLRLITPREVIEWGPLLIKGRNQLQITQAKKKKVTSGTLWGNHGMQEQAGAPGVRRPTSREPELL